MNKNLLDEILSDTEKMALQQFVEHDLMREAVKKVLLCGIYNNGTLEKDKPVNPLYNFALTLISNNETASNERIGEQLRSSWEGIKVVELAFNSMAKYKQEEPKKVVKNQAR